MMDRVLEAIDRRINEVLRRSDDAKRALDGNTMYRLNTAYHWLTELREDIVALTTSERAEK